MLAVFVELMSVHARPDPAEDEGSRESLKVGNNDSIAVALGAAANTFSTEGGPPGTPSGGEDVHDEEDETLLSCALYHRGSNIGMFHDGVEAHIYFKVN